MSFTFKIKAPNVIHYYHDGITRQVNLDSLKIIRKTDSFPAAVVFKASSYHKDLSLPNEPMVVYVNTTKTSFDKIVKIVIKEIFTLMYATTRKLSTATTYANHLIGYDNLAGIKMRLGSVNGILRNVSLVMDFNTRMLSESNYSGTLDHQGGKQSFDKPTVDILKMSFKDAIFTIGGKIL